MDNDDTNQTAIEWPQPPTEPQPHTPQAEPEPTPQPEPEPEPKSQPEPEPKPKPQPESEPKPEGEPLPQTRIALIPSEEQEPTETATLQDVPSASQRSSVIIHPQVTKVPRKPMPIPSVSIPIGAGDLTPGDTTHTIVSLDTARSKGQMTPNSPMHRRKNTLEIEGSLFKENESKWSVIWLLYTFLYWTLLTWIPILVTFEFGNWFSLVAWCLGFIGMICTAYTIKIGHYPSGSTRENACDINGSGRYSAAMLTTCVIIDCCILVFVSVDLENIDAADSIIYNTNLSRLVLHMIHIFWSSLFFYNRFYYNHRAMAIRAFILEWGDIIWSCIVSFMITEPLAVDKIYFVIVGVALIGWIAPMMFIKRWGTRKNAQKVAIHLLLLDLCTDGPVIIALLVTQAYKNNVILWIDLIWKSGLLARSVSVFSVKYYLRSLKAEPIVRESSEIYGVSLEAITFVWLIAVGIYWSTCALMRCVIDNEIGARNYEYYTWFAGMIGLFFIYDAALAGHSAEKRHGKPFMAFTCLVISIDSVLHAYELLAGHDDADDFVGEAMMICHCVALVSSILFYSHSFKKGIRYSFLLQWIDIILMFIVIEILNGTYSNLADHGTGYGSCFSKSLCIGYFVVFSIKIIFWFAPILLGYGKSDRSIHLHMVLLDSFTDLPLVLIIFFTHAYDVNSFIFVDIAFKILMLAVTYAYHLIISLLLSRCIGHSQS